MRRIAIALLGSLTLLGTSCAFADTGDPGVSLANSEDPANVRAHPTRTGTADPAATRATDPSATRAAPAYHYTHNTGYDAAAADVGFNVWDVGPEDVASLPAGHLGLIWYGGGDYGTCEPSETTAAFKAQVDALATSDKVYGWYLWDEPAVERCGDELVALLEERAAYIRERTGGAQLSFVVAGGGDGEPVPPELAPDRSGLDLLGLDPYPCRLGEECEYDLIDRAVAESVANGTPMEHLVPVYQAFGHEDCSGGDAKWRMPTAEETAAMFERWDEVHPAPVFDMAYSWNRQPGYACPALADRADLQDLYRARFSSEED